MARNGCAPEQHAGKGDNAETQGASFATSFSTEDGELEAQEKLKGLWDGCHAQETQCATAGGGKKINLSWGYWRCLRCPQPACGQRCEHPCLRSP